MTSLSKAHAPSTAHASGHAMSGLWLDLIPEYLTERIQRNRFLSGCSQGRVSAQTTRSFMIQHHYYAKNFTRYLCALMSRIQDDAEFSSLSENLLEEIADGGGQSHAAMYRQSMYMMLAPPLSEPPNASTSALIHGMSRYCHSEDPLDGLSAMCLGAEAIVPLIYGPVLDNMRGLGAPEEAMAFFILHIEEDEDHAIVMRNIIDRMLAERPHLKQKVVAIGEDMIQLRLAMLDEIFLREQAS